MRPNETGHDTSIAPIRTGRICPSPPAGTTLASSSNRDGSRSIDECLDIWAGLGAHAIRTSVACRDALAFVRMVIEAGVRSG